ncbi:hypothetical protein M011DRAFT_473642 [Sporormia fimetaria CBS 119925]|uniref:Jacalin-type lectin domain-containing protein n=1 Tax=Sporormia fimetaria CBS 119925 TaxID=1340428 RepID=A0A6A6VKJ4_9PLEO|nr:hypothetical protein M011DRAFT_473642 [Sporormia fimetaria CBS 119925]
MLLSLKKLAFGALLIGGFCDAVSIPAEPVPNASLSVRSERCGWENAPFTGPRRVGADKGTLFCETRWEAGLTMTGVEAWASKKGVLAVQFFYSDGSSTPVFGKIGGDRHARLDWDPTTTGVEQVRSWGDGRAKMLGRLYMRLRNGDTLDVGKDIGGQDAFETQVHSGILMGVEGHSDDVVYKLGLRFLRSPVKKMRVGRITFDETPEELNKKMQGIQSVDVYSGSSQNSHSAPQKWKFATKQSVRNTKTWQNTATHGFGYTYTLEVSGQLLGIGASGSHALAYTYEDSKTTIGATEQAKELGSEVEIEVKPGETMYCAATAWFGQYDGKYNAHVELVLEDGFEWGFKNGGMMHQIAWSEVSTHCDDHPVPVGDVKIEDLVKGDRKRGVGFVA